MPPGGGRRVRKKRSTNNGGDGEYGPRTRSRTAAAADSAAGNGETGDVEMTTEDHNINVDEINEIDDNCTGEELIYDYSDDDADAEVDDADAAEPTEQRYVVLSQDAIRARQDADIAEVAEVLSVPPGFAAVLLRHFKWRAMRVQEEWFAADDADSRIRDAVGLPAADAAVPTALSRNRLSCGICFVSFAAGATRAAACSAHFYCDDCWRGYIGAAVEDGARCLSLRCPDPSCSAAVARELVDAVAAAGDRDRYARFALWSFVDESGGRVKWCPGRVCDHAVEFAGAGVFCTACGHGFCFGCGEEAHRPVSCDTVRAWVAKNASDSETANWVLTHTKHCPKCRRPIEKNQGCNHMTCRAPCYHSFCWICLQAMKQCECDGYRRGGRARSTATNPGKEEWRREQAKASLDRYLYHYERWAAHHASLLVVFKDMAELDREGLEKMAATVRVPASDLGFLTKAYEQVAECRRVLRWAHAYGYFLDPERDAAKRNLFDQLQKDANMSLERLHGCAEVERKELLCADDDDVAERYRSYRKKLENLTNVTRHYFKNLVKAFETDLSEVETAK